MCYTTGLIIWLQRFLWFNHCYPFGFSYQNTLSLLDISPYKVSSTCLKPGNSLRKFTDLVNAPQRNFWVSVGYYFFILRPDKTVVKHGESAQRFDFTFNRELISSNT